VEDIARIKQHSPDEQMFAVFFQHCVYNINFLCQFLCSLIQLVIFVAVQCMSRQHFCAVSNIVASSMDSNVVSATTLSVGPLLPLPGNKPAAASADDSADEQVAPSCNKDTTVVVEGVGFAVVIVIAFAAFAIGVMLMSSLWFIYVKTSTFYRTLLSFLLLLALSSRS